MIKNISFVALAATLFSGCIFGGEQKEEWEAYLYPDKTNTKRAIIVPIKYPTLEICRQSAIDLLKKRGLENTGTYKCGKNCSFHEGMKVDICEEMKK